MAERVVASSFSSETQTLTIDEVDNKPEVFEDTHIKEIGLVKQISIDKGSINLVGPPVEFSELNNSIRSPPPKLAQDTVQILKHLLSYSDKKIDMLKRNGDIQ